MNLSARNSTLKNIHFIIRSCIRRRKIMLKKSIFNRLMSWKKWKVGIILKRKKWVENKNCLKSRNRFFHLVNRRRRNVVILVEILNLQYIRN